MTAGYHGVLDLIFVTRDYFYNLAYIVARVKELTSCVNTLITRLNRGRSTSITDRGNGNIIFDTATFHTLTRRITVNTDAILTIEYTNGTIISPRSR